MELFEYVKKEALRFSGVPVLVSEIKEDAFRSEIIEPALYEYYIYAPYEHALTREVGSSGTVAVDIPDLNSVRSDWPKEIDHEFVGLVSLGWNNTPVSGWPISLGALLDVPDADWKYRHSPAIISGEAGIQAITNDEIDATVTDGTVPDPVMSYDAVVHKLYVYAPSSGCLGLVLGYRLDSIDYVKPSHAVAFSKIATKKYLELMISARASVVISGDVTIDVESMRTKLEQINENFATDMEAIATPCVLYG